MMKLRQVKSSIFLTDKLGRVKPPYSFSFFNPMNSFTLQSGRRVNKSASFCVATKTRGRWHHRYFKSWRGAQNEFKNTQRYLRDADMVAYYGLEAVTLIKPD